MSFRKLIFLSLILLLILSCAKRQEGRNQDFGKKETEIVSISVEKPKREMIELVIETTGTLYAIEESNVAFEVDGKITEVLKDLGDYVKRGDVLAKISPEEYALKKAQSEADFKNAEAEMKRVEELYEKKFATEQQLDSARRNLNVAKSQFELASKKLSDCVLRSPVSGFIAKRMINQGEYVRTGTVAFYVVNTSVLKFRTEIPERYSGYVMNNDRVLIDAGAGKEIEGNIFRISPSVNPDSRAFPVEVRVENKNNLLKPGSFGKGRVFASYKFPALTISESTVTFFSGVPKVFKVIDARVFEQNIVIRERVDRRFIVDSGITENDTIAASLVDTLINKQPVRIKE
ncbi:MAG: efflux RND transporter periplasmic adaptor subunit [Deltaproteobacteria bacterium]|nr:efflux RND transporter periplasmic adaptor subunit [Deltaproteobacteria bacterium]